MACRSPARRWLNPFQRWTSHEYTSGRFRTRADLWRFGLRSALILLGIVGPALFVVGNWNRHAWGRDTVEVYLAAQRIRHGAPLYAPWIGHGPDILSDRSYPVERMPYPPFLPAALSWASPLGFFGFTRLFYLIGLSCLFLYGFSLARIASRSPRATDSFVWVGAVFLVPGGMRGLAIANPEPVLWALYGMSLAFPLWRGFGFASAASIKIFGGWPLLFAIRREGRRVLASAVAAVGIASAIAVSVLGWRGFLSSLIDWFRFALPGVSQGYFSPQNISLSMLALRLARVAGWTYVAGPLPLLPHVWLLAAGVLAPLIAGFVSRRRSPEVQYASVLCAALAFSPVCWLIYLPAALIPCALWIRTRDRAHGRAGTAEHGTADKADLVHGRLERTPAR